MLKLFKRIFKKKKILKGTLEQRLFASYMEDSKSKRPFTERCRIDIYSYPWVRK